MSTPSELVGGRRLLAVASAGGHFKQLLSLVVRIPDVCEVTWVTYDAGSTADLLAEAGRADERIVHIPYAAPRDLANLARDALEITRLLREEQYDLVVSTGAGVALAALPVARSLRVRAVFIESATRQSSPSLAGRMLARVPGIERYSQQPDGSSFGPGWRAIGSVHDGFAPGADRPVEQLRRVVVTLGTIRPYGFRRLVERLVQVLPPSTEVLWQTGATDVSDLEIDARVSVPAADLVRAMAEADVVIAHAGTGTALTAFELGKVPVLVPRRPEHGEHVDDHQVATAVALADRGIAIHAEVEQLTAEFLRCAASRTVERRTEPTPLDL